MARKTNKASLASKTNRASLASKTNKASLASMSIEALFKLRDEVAEAISSRADNLRRQLEPLTGTNNRGRKPRRKVVPQFRSKKNPQQVWSGRGITPLWMREEMKGTKLTKESFRIK
jgi:DNA-binding protein H-NS